MKNKKVKISGVEYELQGLPTREALELRKSWQVKGEVDEITMYESILEHVVINPKVTIDDFESVSDLEELMVEASQFVYSKKK